METADYVDSDDEFGFDENLDDQVYEDDVEIVEKSENIKTEEDDDSNYEVISSGKIAEEMDAIISEVSSVINIPKTTTRILLNHSNWDKDKLLEKYYDGDQETFFREAHVVNPFKTIKSLKTSESSECQVCFSTVEPTVMSGLQCGHLFCTDCWDEYLKTKVTSEGQADSIPCAAYKCDVLVDDDSVKRLLKSPQDKAKYQRLIMNSFVSSNKLFRWCPFPGCTNVIKGTSSIKPKLVRCKCSHIVFCFSCGEDRHEPIDCSFLRKWIKKCTDDSETMHWLKVNTKNCPKCDSFIEKNGGCNRILCRQCTYQFCWICMEAWTVHGYSNPCSKFVSKADADGEAKEKSQAALEKYLFYANRYIIHQQSLKLESKLHARIETEMDRLMNEHNLSFIDLAFLKNSVDILRSCRQTLSYSYALAFYMIQNNQTMIYEDNQNDLHCAVESLSGYLEKDMESQSYAEIRMKVLDKCRYCQDRRKTLLQHVVEGNDKSWWHLKE